MVKYSLGRNDDGMTSYDIYKRKAGEEGEKNVDFYLLKEL